MVRAWLTGRKTWAEDPKIPSFPPVKNAAESEHEKCVNVVLTASYIRRCDYHAK